MIAFGLCVAAFGFCFVLGRRSLGAGLVAVFAVGYGYGILRANLLDMFTHFVFDSAVIGLYLAQLTKRLKAQNRVGTKTLRLWLALLILWPCLLLLVPQNDPLIELVGLRGNIFLLPFILLGARLDSDQVDNLAVWLAVLNLIVFGVAVAEFSLGVPMFYPKNVMTELIYRTDLVTSAARTLRIPATFTGAHAYAGTMVMTVPLLAGAWFRKQESSWRRYLILAGLIASMLGVFMGAARIHMLVLFLLVIVATFSSKSKALARVGWALMLIGIGWIVSGDERLQRFTSLQDTEAVTGRVGVSVNRGFFDLALRYPMGNGLGGATNTPYFLKHLSTGDAVTIENEYGRIMLEQGIPGLLLWLSFLVWFATRRNIRRTDDWFLGRRLAWFSCMAYFAMGPLGTGMLTSIPHTCFMLLYVGWVVVPEREKVPEVPAKPVVDRKTIPVPRLTMRVDENRPKP